MEPVLIGFCKAHEALREEARRTEGARQERRAARRALKELVQSSMVETNVQCVEAPTADGTVYLRLAPPAPPRRPLDAADIIDIARTACAQPTVESAPPEEMARALQCAVATEIRQRRPPVGEARLVVARSAARGGALPLSQAQPELRHLASQFMDASKDVRTDVAALRPLKQAQRVAESAVIAHLNAPVAVRMRQGDGASVALHIERRERASRRTQSKYGIRDTLRICTEAAEVAAKGDRAGFAARLHEELTRVLAQPGPAKAAVAYVRVDRRRLP